MIFTDDRTAISDLKYSSFINVVNRNTFSIEEFDELVKAGSVSDDAGIAVIVVDGEEKPEYNVSINRQCVVKSGSIVSFWGLLKMHGEENIQIKFLPKCS